MMVIHFQDNIPSVYMQGAVAAGRRGTGPDIAKGGLHTR